jgi:hypothetical protein
MPASEHPVFLPPDDPGAQIWRYMDFTKFVSMLDNGGVFFCRADKLGDKFEARTRNALWQSVPQFQANFKARFRHH